MARLRCRPCASTPRGRQSRLEQIIFTNVRTPDERRGDLRAQIAANLRGTTRLAELAVKYGTDRLLQIMQAVMDYSERMMRAALAALPDGVARFEDFCDGDGVIEEGDKEDMPFWIRMQVTKAGDRLIVDFAGTDAQVSGPMNAPLAVTASGIYTAIKMIADPRDLVPPNSGCWRPVELRAEPGTVVNAVGAARWSTPPRDLASQCAKQASVRAARAARAGPRDGCARRAPRQFDAGRCRLPDRWTLREYERSRAASARPDERWHQRPVERHSNTMNTPIEISR